MLSIEQGKAATPAPCVQAEPGQFVLTKRIGSTTYRVGVHFSKTSKETLNEKIIRLIKNDLQFTPKNVKMEPLQAGWLPERSSL